VPNKWARGKSASSEEAMINEQQHQAIATQAYHLWKQEGCPDGRSMEHWLNAEQTVLSKDEPVEMAKPAKKAKTAPAKAKPAASTRNASTKKKN
jgi:hypothetical protein